MPFEPANWVLVCDTKIDEHSRPQIEKIREFGYEIKGAIECNDEQFQDSEACKKVPAFPCFCNVETSTCVSGFRDTPELFHDLQLISDRKNKKT
jgi:hypothetical protein